VAGKFGFAHYSLLTKKWKLFGNITQVSPFFFFFFFKKNKFQDTKHKKRKKKVVLRLEI
jgi:hypothetical protein